MKKRRTHINNDENAVTSEQLYKRLHAVSDLFEFYENWPNLKPIAQNMRNNPDMSEADKLMLKWLIHLADRITRRDIEKVD